MDLPHFFPEPALDAGETIRETWLANRTQYTRTVGGRLYLTTKRVAFEPHVVDAHFGAENCSLLLSDIAKVGLQPGEFKFAHLFDGGLRTRLSVEPKAGEPEYFVVQHPEKAQQVIAEAVASAAGGVKA